MRLSWRQGPLLIAVLVASPSVGLAAERGDPRRGKALYQYGCTVCHGDEGRGDGPASKSFNPRPRDLSDALYIQGLSDDYLFRVIKMGGGLFGKPNMPAWSYLLKDEEIRDLIAYLRTPPKR